MPKKLKPCGTIAAYRRHLRNGEPSCDVCRKAWADYCRALWQGRIAG
jgi:hypothetical protein